MFKTIIWATDGSEGADGALPFAKELARREGGKLIAAHCNEILAGKAPGFPLRAEDVERVSKIRGQVHELRADGWDVELVVLSGASAEAGFMLADLAAQTGADVIVAGTRGHWPLAGAIVGSVTQQLLHAAPCPVLAVPGKRQPPDKSERTETHSHA